MCITGGCGGGRGFVSEKRKRRRGRERNRWVRIKIIIFK